MGAAPIILALGAAVGLSACSFAPIASPMPTDPAASMERREDNGRRARDRANLCRLTPKDDARYESMNCKRVLRGGAA